MNKVKDVLNHRIDNHILPFFWVHGEDKNIIINEIEKIDECGIKEICIESRPHPDYAGMSWWKDMDHILEECKKRDMKIWLLDDSHFPTGFANGAIKTKFPQYKKRFLKLYQLDFAGPVEHANAIIKYAFSDSADKLIGVYLAKKVNYTEVNPDTLFDITENVKNNRTVSFLLPDGEWRLFVVLSTFSGGEIQTQDYLNPIDPEATDILIQEVYETHYEHYKEEFGKTIQGFFSDEPRFGNAHGADWPIGEENMVLPWREDLCDLLNQRAGYDMKKYLPLLWINGGEKAKEVRFYYMDLISDLYAEHFSGRIGAWCEKHGVNYIGHVIEDNNAHARTGYGAGHFFKSMRGQHMAGIDVVIHQLLPGMDHGYYKAMTQNGWDGEFFHYCLGKLGSSLAHIDENKKGRAMCEVFGAYGWAEGTKLMKWIIDYMLVRGINYFVPHAFNPKEYPDRDCPPHFYAHGKNPQFKEFGELMQYTNRMCHLFSDGIHRAPVALCYHGEAEWSGAYMLMQKPAAELSRNQIDFDIIPQAALQTARYDQEGLHIGKESFRALVIPYGEAWPEAFLEKVVALEKAGLPVYFLDKLPNRFCETNQLKEKWNDVYSDLCNYSKVTGVKELAFQLKESGMAEITVPNYEPYLRYYHYEQQDGCIYMFTNEHPSIAIDTIVEMPGNGKCYQYDAFQNIVTKKIIEHKENKNLMKLQLEAYESCVVIFSKEELPAQASFDRIQEEIEIQGPYDVAWIRNENYPKTETVMQLEKLVSLQQIEGMEDFCGIIRYTTRFLWNNSSKKVKLLLNGVTESARVFVNEKPCGISICPPYQFDLSDAVVKGENRLSIEVTTTLVRENYDWLSQFMLLEETGLTGEIKLQRY